jgi:flagellar biosynthesis protein FlhG
LVVFAGLFVETIRWRPAKCLSSGDKAAIARFSAILAASGGCHYVLAHDAQGRERQMDDVHCVQVIAVTGGKGGVGKTTVAVNLSLALAKMGRRVVLLDADLGLANIDILLGLTPRYTLADVLEGRCELSEALMPGPGGIRVAPASSGLQNMTHLEPAQYRALIQAFSDIGDKLDVLIIDTAAGIGGSVINFIRASQEVLVVVCDEPTSISGAYGLIKLLNLNYGLQRFRVLANMTGSPAEGRNLFAKLEKITEMFLDVSLQYVGAVPNDESAHKAVQKGRAVFEAFPRSKCAQAFQALAHNVDSWPLPTHPRGHVEFFVEQLVHNSGR